MFKSLCVASCVCLLSSVRCNRKAKWGNQHIWKSTTVDTSYPIGAYLDLPWHFSYLFCNTCICFLDFDVARGKKHASFKLLWSKMRRSYDLKYLMLIHPYMVFKVLWLLDVFCVYILLMSMSFVGIYSFPLFNGDARVKVTVFYVAEKRSEEIIWS